MAAADRRPASADPSPVGRVLRAGNVYAQFELGDVRFVRLGDLPLLDRIYVRIRDSGWGTVPMRAELSSLEQSRSSFHIVSSLRWGDGPGWATGVLDVWASDRELLAATVISFHQTAVVQRAGLNLHHPLASTIGRRYSWTNGTESGEGTFPEVIYPQILHQNRFLPMIGPFDRLVIDADTQTEFAFTFDGALFETEDQRNWTDASFKTYGPPIDGPQARPQAAGTTISQSVLVKTTTRRRTRGAAPGAPLQLAISRQPLPPLPPIGVTAASLWTEPSPSGTVPGATQSSVTLGTVEHVRIDVWPEDTDSVERLARTAAQARDQAIPVELALRGAGSAPSRLGQILQLVKEVPLRGILALGTGTEPTSPDFVDRLRYLTSIADISAVVGAGTAGHFSEVNRARASVAGGEVVAWSTSPQVHEPDDVTIMQAAPIVAETADSAARIWPGLGLALSPIRMTPPDVDDPRAHGAFGAAWLVAVLAGLAGTSCSWLTFDLPLRGSRTEGLAPPPVSRVLSAVSRMRHLPLARTEPVRNRSLAVFAALEPDGARILIAELAGRSGRVRIPGRITNVVTVSGTRRGRNVVAAQDLELALDPYEVIQARVHF